MLSQIFFNYFKQSLFVSNNFEEGHFTTNQELRGTNEHEMFAQNLWRSLCIQYMYIHTYITTLLLLLVRISPQWSIAFVYDAVVDFSILIYVVAGWSSLLFTRLFRLFFHIHAAPFACSVFPKLYIEIEDKLLGKGEQIQQKKYKCKL